MSYKEDVAKAVADPAWQKFRLSLKGLQTKEKLHRLLDYYNAVGFHRDDAMNRRCSGCEHLARQCICVSLCVYNYLTALARGGQIAVTPNYVDDLENGKLRVLK